MGIMNGARTILQHLPAGLYARNPTAYNIYVDGELIRYKGMITENLTKSDAELAIARTSYLYLRRLLRSIEEHLGRRAERVVVYMDGARVANKVADRPEFMYDATLIRTTFSAYCLDNGIEMRHLEYGESELQMYLMRDTATELNVLVTADSDTLAIAYGHRARPVDEEDVTPTTTTTTTTTTTGNATSPSLETTSQEGGRITDRNATHSRPVRDSCLWVNCSSGGVVAYGMDDLQDRVGYAPFAFRVFLALCGTDFTPQMYTDSMIGGVMTASASDREFINGLRDVNELAALFLLLGLRGDGTIKRKEAYDCTLLDTHELLAWLDNVDRLVSNYIEYTETGKMNADSVPKPKMSILCRFYLFAMRDGTDVYVRKAIQTWAKHESLRQALERYRDMTTREREKDEEAEAYCRFAKSMRLAENRGAASKRLRRARASTPYERVDEECNEESLVIPSHSSISLAITQNYGLRQRLAEERRLVEFRRATELIAASSLALCLQNDMI